MSEELQKKDQNTSLAPAPSFMESGDRRGLETITKEDMLVPRLALAQALSPEVTKGDPKQIPGMQAGDMFNSVTKQNYGPGPLHIQIIRKDKLRAMEFIPLEKGGGVKDPNVPIGDSRLAWGEDGSKPKATLFRDYLAVLLPNGTTITSRELIALSFKSSGIKVAKELNGLIALRNKPVFAGRYVVTSDTNLKPKPHQVYVIQNADWVGEQDYKQGAELWEAMKDLDVQVHDRQDIGDTPADDVPF